MDISNQTALKTIESDDWDSMQNMTYHGAEVTADGKNGYVDYSIKHCVNAGKIFAESNPYEDKDVDHRKYDNSVAVLVKADKGSETGTLYIGAGKRANEGGYAFLTISNFSIWETGSGISMLRTQASKTLPQPRAPMITTLQVASTVILRVLTSISSPLLTTYAATSMWAIGKALFFLAH